MGSESYLSDIVKQKEKELQWHEFYLKIAEQYSQWSKDKRTQVGCIIVPDDFSKILAVGYNGWERGGPDLPDSEEPGQSGAVHAEVNCCIKLSDRTHPNCYLYTTHSPCAVCARVIVNLGCIRKVIYRHDYRVEKGKEVLRERGIEVIKI